MSDKLTKQTQRQIEIYKKHHIVDEENKTISITLHYEKLSDIICTDMGDKDNPAFNRDIIERINELLNTFPIGFKLNLDLKIDDYEGYNPNKVLEAFSEYFELESYRTQKQIKKTMLLVMLLLFIGVGLLLILNVLHSTGVLKESLSDLVLDYFLDTAACVFMWEAVSQLFIYPAEFVTTNTKVFALFNSVRFLDKKDNVMAEADKSTLCQNVVLDSKKKKVGNIFLIVTGSAHIIVGIISLVNFLVELSNRNFSQYQVIMYSILVVVVSIVQVIYGIGAINRFREKGPFRNFTFLLSIVLFILYAGNVASLVVAAVSGMTVSASMIASLSISVIATVMTLIGCTFTREDNKLGKK